MEVVLELVECGVGIATDGLKCGLIGCAFGLVGVALDIAFTLATGGLSKASEAACTLSGAATFDDNSDDGKQEQASILSPILLGVGSAVCTINEKLEDDVLQTVCDLKETAENIDSGLAIAELIVLDPISFKFLETFRNAMCGSPGSAVFDLLEEVVSCSTGCADEDNVFCPADQEEDEREDTEVDVVIEEPSDDKEAVPGEAAIPVDPESNAEEPSSVVEYDEFLGQACRNNKGDKGNSELHVDY